MLLARGVLFFFTLERVELLDKLDVLCMDSTFRSFVISNYPDIIALQKEVSRVNFFDDVSDYYKEDLYLRLETILKDNELSKIYKEAEKINSAYYSRVSRVKKRILSMFTSKYSCYFCTFTFNDDSLNLKSSTRRQYITRFLSSLCDDYVANIDFGEKNGREHYHCVCCSSNDDFAFYVNLGYRMGYCHIKPIIKPCEASLSKYLCKLTAHALKATTKNSKIIYKRY